jgi:hypothetical protein
MKRPTFRVPTILNFAVVYFFLQIASAQTKPGSTSPANQSSPLRDKAVPNVRCTDPDSQLACKSFKQLLDARDKDLLSAVLGDSDMGGKHYSYVCFHPKDDAFRIVEFYEPQPSGYRPYTASDSKEGTSLVMTFRKQSAFPYSEGKSATQLWDIQSKWLEDHKDYLLYDFGATYVESFEAGNLALWREDFGKWSRKADDQGRPERNGAASFDGAHYWLENTDAAHYDELAKGDDAKYAQVSLDESSIYVRYSFKNNGDSTTEYTLKIRRSTGRFTETFKSSLSDSFDSAGTCLIFK